MLILIKQYGRMILTCITAVFVFGAAFFIRSGGNTGFIRIAFGKAMADMGNADVTSYTDAAAVKMAAARNSPEIVYTYQKALLKTAINLETMFLAKDADGNPAVIEITDVLDAAGESLLYVTKEDRKNKKQTYNTAEFFFTKTGIYTLKVKAVDAEKKMSYSQYKIPVTSN